MFILFKPACEPDRDGEAALALLRRRGENIVMLEGETGALEPPRHHVGGNAEPAVRVHFPQLLEIMRREIDDHQASTGLQHPCGLGQGAPRLIEIVKDLVKGNEIG
jgi:hypothetical protein